MRATFKQGSPASFGQRPAQNGNEPPGPPKLVLDVAKVSAYLGRRNAARPADIALEFGVPKSDVEPFITEHNNVFIVAKRGWVKLKSSTTAATTAAQ